MSFNSSFDDQDIETGSENEEIEQQDSGSAHEEPEVGAAPVDQTVETEPEPNQLESPSSDTFSDTTEPSTERSSPDPQSNRAGGSGAALRRKERKIEEVATSKLLDPIVISFTGEHENNRNQNRDSIVPKSFYRTSYETSITLSSHTSKDTHAKHREFPELKISLENAFQAMSPFSVEKDLTRERIERHLIWNKKKNASSYVSMFNSLACALRRAEFHYKSSYRIGHRVFIARISTEGLVAASVSAQCETTVTKIEKPRSGSRVLSSNKYTRDVNIPVWVRDVRGIKEPGSYGDLTLQEFTDIGFEIYLFISEINKSDLTKGPKSCTLSRNYLNAHGLEGAEWLAAGAILESRVLNVMPFDGRYHYKERTTRIIRSLNSTDPWVWDWDSLRWVMDQALFDLAEWRGDEFHEAHEKREHEEKRSKKRQFSSLETADDTSAKRPKLIELNIIRPYLRAFIKFSHSK